MGGLTGVIVGLIAVVVGLAVLFDVRGFGSRAIRLSLHAAAPPWKSDPRPDLERVDLHRTRFGAGLVAIGLVIVTASAVALAS